MLSIGKLLFLAIVILIVWYGVKFARRVEQVRTLLRRAQENAARQNTGGGPRIDAEDMVKCRSCGTYVAAQGAKNCGRADCPWTT